MDRINLRNQHFQNAGRWARDRARGPHFENVDFKGKGLMAATPPHPPWFSRPGFQLMH